MTRTLTIHDIDAPVSERLRAYAERGGKSLNQSVKELLSAALGVTAKPKMRFDNGLRRFRGAISAKYGDALLTYVENADFSKIEAEDM